MLISGDYLTPSSFAVNTLERRVILVCGLIIILGALVVALGLIGVASLDSISATYGDAESASNDFMLISGGVFAIVAGLVLIRKRATLFPAQKQKHAQLVGGLGGGGGTLALLSTRGLFLFLLTSDYFNLELFVAEVSIGVFLVLLAVFFSARAA